MKTMRTTFYSVAVGLSLLFLQSALAASPDTILSPEISSLSGTGVSIEQLGKLRAKGDVVVSSVSNGSVTGNSVGSNSVTGTITNNQSANYNSGLTTVFQNTGNNSLFQSSTSIYISVH